MNVRTPQSVARRTPSRLDPTKTGSLRRKFARHVSQQFALLKRQINELLLTDRALGSVTGNALSEFASDPDNVAAFEDWLRNQLAEVLMNATEEDLWRRYTEEGYRKGTGRAFDDTSVTRRRDEYGYDLSRETFLRESFGHPVSVDKVKLLAGRSYSELKNVSQDMSNKMTRVMVDGLVMGKSPREIARDLVTQVGLSKERALLVATTEIVRAHASGQLMALDKLGVEEVGVAVEWSTSGLGVTAKGNPSPCKLCSPLKGVVLKIAEAEGLIPRHPRCLCSWIPANVGEDKTGQIRTAAGIGAAVSASKRAASGNGRKRRQIKAGKGRKTVKQWATGLVVSPNRPKSIVDNAFCPTGLGGGVDPTCSPKKARKSKAQVVLVPVTAVTSPEEATVEHWEFQGTSSRASARVAREQERSIPIPDPFLPLEERTAQWTRIYGHRTDAERHERFAEYAASKVRGIKEFPDRLKRIFGEGESGRPDLASAVGAPDYAVVKVFPGFNSNSLSMTLLTAPGSPVVFSAHRTARIEPNGDKVMHNDSFFISWGGGKGLGSTILADQVENLKEKGFRRIETWAARGTGMNGYYTWPRLGYDQPISKFRDVRTRQRILKAFPEAKSVLDVMSVRDVSGLSTDGEKTIRMSVNARNRDLGRSPKPIDSPITGDDWWYVHGTQMRHAEFDLTEGSRSLRVMAAYLEERKTRVTATQFSQQTTNEGTMTTNTDNLDDVDAPQLEQAEEVALTDEEEAALDAAWVKITKGA